MHTATKQSTAVGSSSSTWLIAYLLEHHADPSSYGTPITTEAFEAEFMSESEGASKHAVKKMTRALEVELRKTTVNAPDWYVEII